MIKVTVIMATYNTPMAYLKASVQSILDQTLKDFEFIIVDDYSSYDVKEVVSKLNDDRIKVVRNKTNKGSGYSRNVGIDIAQGDYIAIMDADDIALPNRLERQVAFMNTHPEYDVVSTKTKEFSGDKQLGEVGVAGELSKKMIIRGKVLFQPAAMAKKQVLKSVKYDDYYRRAQDYVLWCELALRGYRMYTMDEILCLYRVNPDDYKKRGLRRRKYEIMARLKYYPKLKANPFEYLYILKSIIAGILPIAFVRAYRNHFVLSKVQNKEN